MRNHRLLGSLFVVIVLGHLFDFLIGMKVHQIWSPFQLLVDIYSRWDPLYAAQPFYVRNVALLSGFVMIPLATGIAISYLRGRPNLPLALFYGGFVTCNNLSWLWTEYHAPTPPTSWTMLFLCAGLWFVLPPVVALAAYRQLTGRSQPALRAFPPRSPAIHP